MATKLAQWEQDLTADYKHLSGSRYTQPAANCLQSILKGDDPATTSFTAGGCAATWQVLESGEYLIWLKFSDPGRAERERNRYLKVFQAIQPGVSVISNHAEGSGIQLTVRAKPRRGGRRPATNPFSNPS